MFGVLPENTQTLTCSQTLHSFTYARANIAYCCSCFWLMIQFCKRFADVISLCFVRNLRGVATKSQLSGLLTAGAYGKSYFNSRFITGQPTSQIFHHLSDLPVFTTSYLRLVFSSLSPRLPIFFPPLCMFMLLYLLFLDFFHLNKHVSFLPCRRCFALCALGILILKSANRLGSIWKSHLHVASCKI